jgi:hypothetical protein
LRRFQLIEDVQTRWWSTFDMLERLIRLKAYVRLLKIQGHTTKDLSDQQWVLVEDALHLLKPFRDAQLLFEGDSYVTASLVPYTISTLRTHLDELINETAATPIRDLAICMRQDMQKRWGSGDAGTVWTQNLTRVEENRQIGIPQCVLLSSALDPRSKSLAGIPAVDADQVWAEIARLMTEERQAEVAQVIPSPTTPRHEHLDQYSAGLLSQPSYIRSTAHDGNLAAQELESYRATEMLMLKNSDGSHNCPALWWSTHQAQFPRVAKLARKYLAQPATDAASERAFHAAGRTITTERASMLPEHASNLILLQSAMKSHLFDDLL